MNKKLREKVKEAFASVLPVTAIVLGVSIVVDMSIGTVIMFLSGALLLILGMGLFSLGADMFMMPMGEGVGGQIARSGKLWLLISVAFFLGFVVTVAEPDLQVLAGQVPSVPSGLLIASVAAGVGAFLVLALLRVLFRISLARLLIGFYLVVFLVSFFVPKNFVSIAFDSGGVTTGPITVPFLMALGLGLASAKGSKDSHDNSFGLVALCSIGPILAVLILGSGFSTRPVRQAPASVPLVSTTAEVARHFAVEFPRYLREVAVALVPILLCLFVFQILSKKYRKRQLLRMGMGFAYTFLGLALFFTGVNVGFIPVGQQIGAEIAGSDYKWMLIPIGMLIGYYIVAAEPAVHVLNRQVEEVSGGHVSGRAMRVSLSIGMAVALAIAMLRVLTGVSIYWFMIPGYAIALGLTFVVPKIFTGIAFDSGGVVSGPLTSTFLLPFAMGACESVGGNIMTDAFGVVAMVAMMPLIAVQIMGLVFVRKMKKVEAVEFPVDVAAEDADNIIELDGEGEEEIVDFDDGEEEPSHGES
ncbi:MAG: DUF1538 domain-containing protein [Oscillospiraceae bacterium]|jgi:hypothetical protein|nr:DUF1538 domain-containing protein [Oscillospiraceae bacterium]